MAGKWTPINIPNSASGNFDADILMLLTDGSVIIHNAYANNGIASAREWLRLMPDMTQSDPNQYYAQGTFTQIKNMNNARQYFASGILSDGRAFVIGGEYSDDANSIPTATPGVYNDTPLGETFDPVTNVWTPINKPANFTFVRGDAVSVVLPDGRVLLGGASTTEPPSTWSARCAIWAPTDDSWTEAGLEFGAGANTTKEDPTEEESWALLQDGSVFAPTVRDTPKAERYVPALDRWVTTAQAPSNLAITTLNGAIVDEVGATILLPNGHAFVVGGNGQTALFTPGPTPTDVGSWTQGPAFPADNSVGAIWPTLTALDAPACLLPNGKIVCVGGTTVPLNGDYFSINALFLEFDPNSNASTIPALDSQPLLRNDTYSYQCWLLLLPTGQILCSAQSHNLFLYTPDPAGGLPDPSWKPANISAPQTMVLGHSYTVSGTQINGLSQAVGYGDDGGMATNYPIVQLTNATDGTTLYVRSYNFSTMGIAPGNTLPDDIHSCTIDIPSNLKIGTWNLVVIANGIASDPVTIQIAA